MTAVTFYFQIHQPYRLRQYSFFDVGRRHDYFDDLENERILKRVADKCYRPMTLLLEELVDRHEGRFKCSFSVSGTALDQLARWAPDVIETFRRMAKTGCVEFLCETTHHSLAALVDEKEFRDQVRCQKARIAALTGRTPTTFRNTELVYSNQIARMAEQCGFNTIMAEGADHLIGWRSPHHLYRPEGTESILTMLRSYKLSDDIAFRFSNRGWDEWPMDAKKFTKWVMDLPESDDVVGLFMDFETFGEHQWEDTGIFDFMRHLPSAILEEERLSFALPSEIAAEVDPIARLDAPLPVSWADAERDLTAWLGNPMQRAAHEALYDLGPHVRGTGDPALLETWRKLTTSDHFYYMCVKFFSDGDVHKYFSPYSSPYDAYIALMNVMGDLRQRIDAPDGLTSPQ